VTNRYIIQRRRKRGRIADLDDEAFRLECISYAALGLSRRGVAGRMRTPESTLRGWIERGMAFPDEEPFGSFSASYRRAERGLEAAAAGTISFTVGRLWRLCQTVERGERPDASSSERELAKGAAQALGDAVQLKELLNVLSARFPADWGTSALRVPEPEYDPQNWLDANSMDREQLAALLSDPPDAIRSALVDAAPAVYAILVAGGFDPGAQKTVATEHDSG
jgi:hypothetical protein